MSNFEDELENIKASLKHLGAIEESLASENYLESRSVSDYESHIESENTGKITINENWVPKHHTESDFDQNPSADMSIAEYNEILKEKTNLINRLYNCIEELKGEITELTASLDYHIQVNSEMEKELEFYKYSKDSPESYVKPT